MFDRHLLPNWGLLADLTHSNPDFKMPVNYFAANLQTSLGALHRVTLFRDEIIYLVSVVTSSEK